MIIEKNRETLSDDILSNFGVLEEKDIVVKFSKLLEEKVKTIKELVEKDYSELSNEELYSLLRQLYGIKIEEKDILKYITKKNHRFYSEIKTIPTTMAITADKKDSRGRILDYWKEKYQVFLEAAKASNKDLTKRDNITKEELKELIANKDIVVLDYDTLEVEDVIRDEEEFDIDVIKFFDISRSMIPNNELYKEEFDFYMELLKRKLPKKELLKDLKKYIEDLQQELYDLFVYSHMSYGYGPISNICKEWYKKSGTRDEINILSKKVGSKKMS